MGTKDKAAARVGYPWVDTMQPKEWDEKQVNAALKKGPLIGQRKTDGVRVHLVVTGQGAYLRSRANLPLPAIDHLGAELAWLDTYGFGGCTFEFEAQTVDTMGNLKTAAETAGDLARVGQPVARGHLVLTLFDFHTEALRKSGANKVERLDEYFAGYHSALTDALRAASGNYLRVATPGWLADRSAIEYAYEMARMAGAEGIVVVPGTTGYISGKKLGTGWKKKPRVTREAVVTSCIPAFTEDGQPKHIIGSFEVTYEDDGSTGRVSAGAMKHDERAAVYRDPESYKGRLMEVAAMEVQEGGTSRHPTFAMWRDTMESKGVKQ